MLIPRKKSTPLKRFVSAVFLLLSIRDEHVFFEYTSTSPNVKRELDCKYFGARPGGADGVSPRKTMQRNCGFGFGGVLVFHPAKNARALRNEEYHLWFFLSAIIRS
jgi:hypothetical protein